MAGMDHPHVIKLLGVFEDSKRVYLAMELAAGGGMRSAYRVENRSLTRHWVKIGAGLVEIVRNLQCFLCQR